MGGINKPTFKKVGDMYANVTPDRIPRGQEGEYKDFKAGEPNKLFTEDEKKKLGKTLLGGAGRKDGL